MTPWTAAYQGPPPVGFSRQEYWSGLPLPSPFRNIGISITSGRASQVTQWKRICLQCRRCRFNPWVRKFPMNKKMATHSSTLAWKTHGWRSLVGCSPWGHEESDTTERLHFHFSLSCIGEGNGNPLQCSCLENPRDGRAWWLSGERCRSGWQQLGGTGAGAAERRYPTSKVRSSGSEDIPLVQGKEQGLRFAGAAVKRYPTSKEKH